MRTAHRAQQKVCIMTTTEDENMNDWTPLKQKVLLDTLKRVDALGVQYKVIAPDGSEYGTLNAVAVKVRKKVKPRYPRGVVKQYVASFLEDMKPGDEVVVPVGQYDMTAIQSALSSYGHVKWGAGGYITARDHKLNASRILRLV